MKRLSKGVWTGMGVGLVAAGFWIAWMMAEPKEPVYAGKKLSEWLENHLPRSGMNPPYGSAEWRKADEALRAIGTNGIPTLLKMIRAHDSGWEKKLREWARKQRFVRVPWPRHPVALNDEAEYAFEVLGTNGASAVPGLMKIYEEAVSPNSQRCAALALMHIGRPAAAAVPMLIRNFTHTNAEVRFYAVSAVGRIRSDAELSVPALLGVLNDPKRETAWNAVVGLSGFRREAMGAVPVLEGLLDERKPGEEEFRKQVELALWRIAPERTKSALVVCSAEGMVKDGVTTGALEAEFRGERRTLIPAGKSVPCASQLWDSEPKGPVKFYWESGERGPGKLLGEFEVLNLPGGDEGMNVGVVPVITEERLVLCARDYTRDEFLEVRRVGGD